MDLGDWLSAVRFNRLPILLRTVQAQRPPGLPAVRARSFLWTQCGGPLDDIPLLLRVLVTSGLVVELQGHFRLTAEGRRVAIHDHQQNGRMLALALIRAGVFAEQARRFVEVSRLDVEQQALICRRGIAQKTAAQLVGLLQRWPDVRIGADVVVPSAVARELLNAWALDPIVNQRGEPKVAIGQRAELYTYQFERQSSADPTKIRWVARDDDSLGYDVEDINSDPARRIEVKGSVGEELRFFLSANELDAARRFGEHYEVQFWGSINPALSPAVEYENLRRAGYPNRLINFQAMLRDGHLLSTPQKYLITRPLARGD
jgi:hypothetical protein